MRQSRPLCHQVQSDSTPPPNHGRAGLVTEVAASDGPEQLRRSLSDALRRRDAIWLHAGGFSAYHPPRHRALLHALEAAGVAGDSQRRALPSTLVFDWTTTETCTADGFALFGVAGLWLSAHGLRPIVCGPALRDLALLLEVTGLRDAGCWGRWIENAPIGANRLRPLGRAGTFGGALGRGNLREFLSDLAAALRAIGTERERAHLIEAVAMDMMQNARAHAGNALGCVVALVEHRRRPARVQIGMADSGPGIPTHVLRQPAYSDLAPFSDLTVVGAVLNHALSGRAGGAGGGFARLATRIVQDFGGEVCVRSGAALVSLGPAAGACGVRLNTGWGTQVLVSMPIKG